MFHKTALSVISYTEPAGKRIAQTNPNQKTYHVNYILKQVRLHRLRNPNVNPLILNLAREKMCLTEQTQTFASEIQAWQAEGMLLLCFKIASHFVSLQPYVYG